MEQLTAVSECCGARLTLPLPDAVGTDGGDLERSVDLTDTDAREWLRGYLALYQHLRYEPQSSCNLLPSKELQYRCSRS